MLKVKLNTEKELPLLNCFDMPRMLSSDLARRDVPEEKIMRKMEP